MDHKKLMHEDGPEESMDGKQIIKKSLEKNGLRTQAQSWEIKKQITKNY